MLGVKGILGFVASGLFLCPLVARAQNDAMSIPDSIGVCAVEDGKSTKACYALVLGGMDHITVGQMLVIVKRFDSGGVSIMIAAGLKSTTLTGKVDGSLIRGTFTSLDSDKKTTGTWTGILPADPAVSGGMHGADEWWYCSDVISYTDAFQAGSNRVAVVLTDVFQTKDLKGESIEDYRKKFDTRARTVPRRGSFRPVGTTPNCTNGLGQTSDQQKTYAETSLDLQAATARGAGDVFHVHWQGALESGLPNSGAQTTGTPSRQ